MWLPAGYCAFSWGHPCIAAHCASSTAMPGLLQTPGGSLRSYKIAYAFLAELVGTMIFSLYGSATTLSGTHSSDLLICTKSCHSGHRFLLKMRMDLLLPQCMPREPQPLSLGFSFISFLCIAYLFESLLAFGRLSFFTKHHAGQLDLTSHEI